MELARIGIMPGLTCLFPSSPIISDLSAIRKECDVIKKRQT